MASKGISDREALAFLIRQAGWGRLGLLAALMLAASLTEGVGLIMLVPIIQLATSPAGAPVEPAWLAPFAELPLGALLAVLVALVGLRALIVFASNESRRALSLDLGRDLRLMAHDAVLNAEWRWLATRNSADHAAAIMGETDRVSSLVNQALSIATALVTIVLLTGSAALISLPITSAIFALALFAGFGLSFLRGRSRDDGEAYAAAYRGLQRVVSNALQHLRAARIADAEDALAEQFACASEELVERERRYFRVSQSIQMLFQIAAAAILALLVYLALAVFGLALAVFLPVVAIFARTVPLIGNVQQGLRSWRYNLPALAGLLALVEDARKHVEPQPRTTERLELRERIECRGVSLRYEARDLPAIEKFDLVIPAGSIVAITGPSGSGKSSLADLLCGLLGPDHGEIAVDGTVLDGEGRARWRRQVAYAEQEPFLLDASIAENLAWGCDEIDEAKMWQALDAASAGFVRDLPDRLETRMGESGRQFSGGERQRIALARALVRQPSLLILDEITAALDEPNSAAIMASIEALRGQMTVVILSHDRALLAIADQLVALAGPKQAKGGVGA
ncbi:ATP-binding cassette domain-containing protein [Altererythrobacter sp.]|uniref:ATP-binding cassette domain-containing protein n=1 Tax=Altererythrobacter sp. TaxID=1872480 RepID=UPI003D121629